MRQSFTILCMAVLCAFASFRAYSQPPPANLVYSEISNKQDAEDLTYNFFKLLKDRAIFRHHRPGNNKLYIGFFGNNDLLYKQMRKNANGKALNGREIVVEKWDSRFTADKYDVLFISNVDAWVFEAMAKNAADYGTLSVTDMGGGLANSADVRFTLGEGGFSVSLNKRVFGSLIDATDLQPEPEPQQMNVNDPDQNEGSRYNYNNGNGRSQSNGQAPLQMPESYP